jgi:hypothetical protein
MNCKRCNKSISQIEYFGLKKAKDKGLCDKCLKETKKYYIKLDITGEALAYGEKKAKWLIQDILDRYNNAEYYDFDKCDECDED